MFDRKIIYDLAAMPVCTVGRRNKLNPAQDPNVPLSAVGVQPSHAVIEYSAGNEPTIKAATDQACEFIHINGVKVKDSNQIKLRHNDRIIFGTSACFLFLHREKAANQSMSDNPPISFESAMEERLQKASDEMPTVTLLPPV